MSTQSTTLTSLTLPVKINLYWDCFVPKDRYDEIDQTFKVNLQNPLFDRIICYYCKANEGSNYVPEPNPIVELVEMRAPLPYYDDLFHLANSKTGHYDINILCNNDIIIGPWVRYTLNNLVDPSTFFCLSRYELEEKWFGSYNDIPKINHELRPCSQDVWVYRGKIKPTFGHFAKGNNWGCDEVIGEEAHRNGYTVSNPSKLFPTFHNHMSQVRENWPNGTNQSRHMYTPNRTRGRFAPYDPLTEPIPYPELGYFGFTVPVYKPLII